MRRGVSAARWEYKALECDVAGFFGPTLHGEALEEKLNEMGADGWELVGMTTLALGSGRSADVVLILKRPLSSTDGPRSMLEDRSVRDAERR